MKMWKIDINQAIDNILRLNFPEDPFPDITLVTRSQTLRLSLAYLSIDSPFFATI